MTSWWEKIQYCGARNRVGIKPPDNALLVDYWDSTVRAATAADPGVFLVGAVCDSVKGFKRGIVRTAPGASNRPTYAADATFKGLSALGYAATGALQLRADTITPDVAAAGSRPYTIHVWHWVGAPAAALKTIFLLGNIAAGGSNLFGHYVAVNNDVLTCSYNGATAAAPIAGVGTGIHVTEFWADGTLLNTRDNDTLQSVSFTGALNVAGISIRDNSQAGDHVSLFDAVFSAKPSDAYITSLKTWIRKRFGVP